MSKKTPATITEKKSKDHIVLTLTFSKKIIMKNKMKIRLGTAPIILKKVKKLVWVRAKK
jgi:hypothetical protein